MVSWGTSPEMVTDIDGVVPEEAKVKYASALEYMDLKPGTRIRDIKLDKIFIGSCTNSRIEDLRAAAAVLENKKISPSIKPVSYTHLTLPTKRIV